MLVKKLDFLFDMCVDVFFVTTFVKNTKTKTD